MRCGFDERCPLLLHVVRSCCDTGVYGLTYTIGHGVKSWCERLDSEHMFSECPPVPHHAHALYVAKRRGFDETSPFLLLRAGFGDDTHDNDATFTLSGSVNAWCEQRWSNRPRFRPLFTPTFTRVT